MQVGSETEQWIRVGVLLKIFDASSLASCELGFATPCTKPSHGSLVPLPNCIAKVLPGGYQGPLTCALLASLPSPGATPQALNFFPCLDYTMSSAPSGFYHAVPCASDTLPSFPCLLLPSSASPSQLLVASSMAGSGSAWACPSLYRPLLTIMVWWLVGHPAGPGALEGRDSACPAQRVFPMSGMQ